MTKHDVRIIEVGPRDGLQNESYFVPTEVKIELINLLSKTGLEHIEVTSFVSPKAIPQLADNQDVFKGIKKPQHVKFYALIPNEHGFKMAQKAGVKDMAIFTAASESFNQHNIHCSIKESIERFIPIMTLAKEAHIPIRAYISCVLGCPYEGSIAPKEVLNVAERLFDLGVKSISLGDTIGVGTPKQTKELLNVLGGHFL